MTTTKEDYAALLEQEEGELLVVGLIEEILTRGQEVLFEKHIESQVLPYAVQFAEDTIRSIIEWEFFQRDNGTIDPVTWLPDEEPATPVIDSWARGAIPIRNQPPPLPTPLKKRPENSSQLSLSQQSVTSSKATPEQSVQQQQQIAGQTPQNAKMLSAMSLNSTVKDKRRSDYSLASGSSATNIKGGKMRPGSGRRSGVQVTEVEVPLSATAIAEHAIMDENKRMLARIQNIEKDGGKVEIGYDNDGRLIIVKKVAPHKIFRQGVKVKVLAEEITPPTKSTQMDLTTSRLQLLNKFNAGMAGGASPYGLSGDRKFSRGDTLSKKTLSRNTVGNLSMATSVATMAPGGFVPDTALDIPLLADTMKLAPGVTLREGDVTKKAPALPRKERPVPVTFSDHTKNRKSDAAAEPATDPLISQVLGKTKPTLRPIAFPAIPSRKPDQHSKLPSIGGEMAEPIRQTAQAQ